MHNSNIKTINFTFVFILVHQLHSFSVPANYGQDNCLRGKTGWKQTNKQNNRQSMFSHFCLNEIYNARSKNQKMIVSYTPQVPIESSPFVKHTSLKISLKMTSKCVCARRQFSEWNKCTWGFSLMLSVAAKTAEILSTLAIGWIQVPSLLVLE